MRLAFFLFLLLPVLASWAQDKPCNGKVLDLATGEAVAGVTIMSIDSSLYVVTDERGRFSFNAQKAGSFRLSRVGYTSELKRIVPETIQYT
ncbi:MAG: carboxypeptidase-like regulatory domain-containing protein [Chitinophagaceae bacterium]|nr:carboxypeptidase-like regulatory domain-containing protein [Chitinophagaceae bacterium]